MSVIDAIAAAGGGKIEKIVEAKAKGEDFKPDTKDAAEQLSLHLILIVVIIRAAVAALRR